MTASPAAPSTAQLTQDLEDPHDRPGGLWKRLPGLEAPALFVSGELTRSFLATAL